MKPIENTSVIIVTFNHRKYIENCLNSLLLYKSLEIIVVDNKSTDGTPEYIEENFPQVKLIKSSKNAGFGAGINEGISQAKKEYVMILNPDVKVKPNSIEKLLKPLKTHNNLITIPKVLHYDGSTINTCGTIIHYTGLAFTRGLGEDPEDYDKIEYVNGLSGVCFAMKKEDYLDLGGFDEQIFLYMEDTLFSWVANSKGFKILFIPKAVIYHNYNLEVTPEKIYHLERGRYMILKKHFTRKEFFILIPSLLITEILTWGYSALNGIDGIKFKFKAFKDVSNMEVTKINSDKEVLLKSLDYKIPENQLSPQKLHVLLKKFANTIYSINYNLVTKK